MDRKNITSERLFFINKDDPLPLKKSAHRIILILSVMERIGAMEKRTDTRIHFDVKGSVEHETGTYTGDIENLSMKGMFLKAAGNIPVGSDVKVKIHLAGASSDLVVNINGRICRGGGNGIAVIFDRIDLDSYTHLRNIITYNMREQW